MRSDIDVLLRSFFNTGVEVLRELRREAALQEREDMTIITGGKTDAPREMVEGWLSELRKNWQEEQDIVDAFRFGEHQIEELRSSEPSAPVDNADPEPVDIECYKCPEEWSVGDWDWEPDIGMYMRKYMLNKKPTRPQRFAACARIAMAPKVDGDLPMEWVIYSHDGRELDRGIYTDAEAPTISHVFARIDEDLRKLGILK